MASFVDGPATGSAKAKKTTQKTRTASPSPTPSPRSPVRALMLSFVFLSVLGVMVSIELTRIHLSVNTDPNYHSVCAVSEEMNCETVAASPYSVFVGLPVSVWGIIGYFVMGVLGFWACSKRRLHTLWPLGLLLLLAALSVATSVVLGFISATRIDSLCLFCVTSYAINAVLLVLAVVAWKQTHRSFVGLVQSDVKCLLARPMIFAALIISGVAVFFALYLFVPSYWRTPGWSDLPKLATGEDENGNHWTGASNPRVTIVEFSDYECPHCRAAHKATRALAAKHPDQIRLIHRHLPLDRECNPNIRRTFHKRACFFAEAAECAGLQGRFWEMNDALFSVQETVKTEKVDPVDLAVRLGLNRSDFKRCLENRETAQRVAADLEAAASYKIRATPSFLIGERVFLGKITEGDLEQFLEANP